MKQSIDKSLVLQILRTVIDGQQDQGININVTRCPGCKQIVFTEDVPACLANCLPTPEN